VCHSRSAFLNARQRGDSPVKESRFDIWLQRASHLSQFGLFLFTVGTIYFTVIPLYQKALLEEVIAKKEVELKAVNESLDKAYVKLRTAIVGQYVFFAGADCSGLMVPSRNITLLPQYQDKYVTQESKKHDGDVFEIDVSACLTGDADRFGQLKDLRVEDRKRFDERLVMVGREIEAIRKRAIEDYKRVSLNSKDAGFFWKKLSIEDAYGDAIRNAIKAIKNIQWEKQ
jgi:hypothetical protein